MDILTPPPISHRSTPDWTLSPACHLDPARFISPPTSIADTNLLRCEGLLTHPLALNVPYGRLTLWWYITDHGDATIKFRIQPNPPDPHTSDCYCILLDPPNQALFFRWEPPAFTILGNWPYVTTIDTWTQYRISWIHGCTPSALSTLTVQFEVLAGPGAADYGLLPAPLNKWADAPSNQIGFTTERFANQWMDDLLLERPP